MSTYELTLFFTIFVFLQFWNLFNATTFASRSSAFANVRPSKVFFATAAAILLGQILPHLASLTQIRPQLAKKSGKFEILISEFIENFVILQKISAVTVQSKQNTNVYIYGLVDFTIR